MLRRTIVVTCGLIAVTVGPAIADACGTAPSLNPPTFGTPLLIDGTLAGGEPSIQPLADGGLLYASHAGTTHLYKPPTDPHDPSGWATTYSGSINTWRSDDDGATWQPVPLLEQETGRSLPIGFSDPSTAVDRAGNVYLSAIDTATVYVGRSVDGRSFTGNKLASFNMDREWLAADEDGVVYMIATPMYVPWPDPSGPGVSQAGRVLWRSTTGGEDWEEMLGRALPGNGSSSPIAINPVDGSLWWPATVYSDHYSPSDVLEWPNARSGDLDTVIEHQVVNGLPHRGGFFNASAFDDAGNHYIAWNTDGSVGIEFSDDGGATYTRSTIATTSKLIRWPWVTAGKDGRVAVAWLERTNASQAWRVRVAVTRTGHGWINACGTEKLPAWTTVTATQSPIHTGYICETGLSCNTQTGTAGDRRLGDYFTIAVDGDGQLVIAYGDTSHDPDAAVSHPAFVRQVEGFRLR